MEVVSILAVTNNQKPSSLKEHKIIIIQFRRLEIWHGSHWPKSRCQQGCSLLEPLGGNSFPCFFTILELAHIPLPMASLLHFQSQH